MWLMQKGPEVGDESDCALEVLHNYVRILASRKCRVAPPWKQKSQPKGNIEKNII